MKIEQTDVIYDNGNFVQMTDSKTYSSVEIADDSDPLFLLDPTGINKCALCDVEFDKDEKWDMYSYHSDKSIKSIFCHKSGSCESKMRKFLRGELKELKLNSLTLSRQNIHCLNCKKYIKGVPKCFRTSYGVSRCVLLSILCSDDCLRQAIKLTKSTSTALKKEGLVGTMSMTCSGCAKIGTGFMKCGRCRINRYCSKACQKLDWKAGHKLKCNKIDD